jgi:hypothetical protein
MTITNMSLHRVIAEIKAIEARLSALQSTAYAFTVPVDSTTETADGKTLSQSNFDKVVSALANLASLKAARNKANASTPVRIGGKDLTIDEALAKKAALAFQNVFVMTLQSQLSTAKARVDQTQAQIEQKIATQVAAASTGTKKATDEEIAVFRKLAERNTKIDIVIFDGLKEKIEALKKDIEVFTTEVDYILSEANATTKVDVVLI